MRVFLASVFHEFQKERQAVQAALNRLTLANLAMEHFGSFPDAPLHRCTALVKSANAFILLIGETYGSVPAGSTKSYTHHEYLAAFETKVPILAFERITDEPRDLTLYESPQRRFVEMVRRNHGVSSFESADDLAWKVACDVAREFFVSFDSTGTSSRSASQLLFSQVSATSTLLVRRLHDRAKVISTALTRVEGPEAETITLFRTLHEKHIEMIEAGRFLEAHEIVVAIHDLLRKVQERIPFSNSEFRYHSTAQVKIAESFMHAYTPTVEGGPIPVRLSPMSLLRWYERVLQDPPGGRIE